MLSLIRAVEPKDEIEAMLAAQMAAVHMATMTFARRLAQAENIAQQDSAQQGFNKLVRSFAAQVETLKRHRTGGEQKVTVQHVTVNEGGQAVVGNISNRRGGARRKKGKPTSRKANCPCTLAPVAPRGRSGPASVAGLPPSGAGRCAASMGPAVEGQRGHGTAATSTGCSRPKRCSSDVPPQRSCARRAKPSVR